MAQTYFAQVFEEVANKTTGAPEFRDLVSGLLLTDFMLVGGRTIVFVRAHESAGRSRILVVSAVTAGLTFPAPLATNGGSVRVFAERGKGLVDPSVSNPTSADAFSDIQAPDTTLAEKLALVANGKLVDVDFHSDNDNSRVVLYLNS